MKRTYDLSIPYPMDPIHPLKRTVRTRAYNPEMSKFTKLYFSIRELAISH